MPVTLPPLTAVAVALGPDSRLSALTQVVGAVSSFVDGSLLLSPPQAALKGSVRLMRRVFTHLEGEKSVELALRQYWLAEALTIAIEKNDLTMVQCIHELHPQPLEIFSLKLALKHGSFEMVQWVIEHRHDRMCCPAGIKNLCTPCLESAMYGAQGEDGSRLLQWMLDEGGLTLEPLDHLMLGWSEFLEHISNLEWLDRHGALTKERRTQALGRAIITSNKALFNYLTRSSVEIPVEDLRFWLISASSDPDNTEFVEFLVQTPLLECLRGEFKFAPHVPGGGKVLQWNGDVWPQVASFALHSAVQRLHVDALKWAYDVHGVNPDYGQHEPRHEDELLGYYEWKQETGLGSWTRYAMDRAAGMGYLRVVEWLHNHRREGCTTYAMDSAATNGHLRVVQWLHQNRSEGCSSEALEGAARNGHFYVVEWLTEHLPQENPVLGVVCAARTGQLQVLKYLFDHTPGTCPRCVAKLLIERTDSRNCRPLNTLRWLDARPSPMNCKGRCMQEEDQHWYLTGVAATQGDIHLLEYLRQHHGDQVREHIQHGLFGANFEQAGVPYRRGSRPNVHGGHVCVAKWLHHHFRDIVNWSVLPPEAQTVGGIHLASWPSDHHE